MSLDLMAFSTDPVDGRALVEAGIDAFVVDWEIRGKHRRQEGADTEINSDTVDDLLAMSTLRDARRVCRINGPGAWTDGEVDCAIEAGATDLLLPMVRHPVEVERYLRRVDGRVRAGILVETQAAVDCASDIASLPLDLVFTGLNDLRIDRGSSSLFEPLVDGTAAGLGAAFAAIPFGIGGATVVDGGDPIPCRLLLAAMEGVGCDFTFLRRSFRRDIVHRDPASEVARIRDWWTTLQARSPQRRAADLDRFRALLPQPVA